VKSKLVDRHSVVHCAYPIDPGERCPLCIGNRDYRDFSKLLVKGYEVGEVESAMECRQAGNLLATTKRKMQIVAMKVDNVEVFRPAKDLFDHQDVMGQRIDAIRVEPERFLAGFDQVSVGDRIAARK
jgi:hypothetical protein